MSQAQREYWAGLIESVVLWSDGDVSVRAASALGRIAGMILDNEPAGHVLVGRVRRGPADVVRRMGDD